jgi:hypothetical protein
MKFLLLTLVLLSTSFADIYYSYIYTKDNGDFYLPVIIMECKIMQINWPNGRYSTISSNTSSSYDTTSPELSNVRKLNGDYYAYSFVGYDNDNYLDFLVITKQPLTGCKK